MDVVEFVEKIIGIKLFNYQKVFLRESYKKYKNEKPILPDLKNKEEEK